MPMSLGNVIVRPFLLLLSLVCLSMGVNAQQASVRADLSATNITRDESVVLTITARGIDAELDASSLNKDFDVVGRSSSRQVNSVIGANGQLVNSSEVTWALELLPKGTGVFTVPAVKVGDLQTQLQTLNVNEVPVGAKRDIFVEATVDTSNPWVQSQVVLTLSVYQAIDIVDGGLDVPSGSDLVIERIGEDVRRNQTRDGRQYSVTERRFALFPQKSGVVTIAPIALSVTVPADPNRVRGFFSPTRKLTRRTEAIELMVQPRPPAGPSWWLPARALTLDSQWQGDPLSATVDTPLTRTLVMRVSGVLDSQLPEITIPAVEGLSLYAEAPQRGMGADGSGLVSEQRISWALIPQRTGTLTLPPISIDWFNTATGEIERTVLQEETIHVAAATGAATAPVGNTSSPTLSDDAMGSGSALSAPDATSPSDSSNTNNGLSGTVQGGSNSVQSELSANSAAQLNQRLESLESSQSNWRQMALAAIVVWLLSAAVVIWRWLRGRQSMGSVRPMGAVRNAAESMHERLAPMSAISTACKDGDLLSVKRALLEWAQRQWPEQLPTTLSSVCQLLPDGAAKHRVQALDVAMYSQSGYDSNMAAVLKDLDALPDELKQSLSQVEQDRIQNNPATLEEGSSTLPPL